MDRQHDEEDRKSNNNRHSYFLRAKRYGQVDDDDEDMANCLIMLSTKSPKQQHPAASFQCKACKKVFNSHQALGGHRASHKRVKGCFAGGVPEEAMEEDEDEDKDSKRPKTTHECSVCRRIFSSGQALGGHKRCHWLTTPNQHSHSFIPNFPLPYEHVAVDLDVESNKKDDQKMKLKMLRDSAAGDDGWLQMGIASTTD